MVVATQEEPERFDPPPFSLLAQPQRPGELAELIEVGVPASEAARLTAAAAVVGLPVELWLCIAVEGERALAEAVAAMNLERAKLTDILDTAATPVPARGPRHLLVRRLDQYADALAGSEWSAPARAEPLTIRVAHRVAARWAHAAVEAGVPFDRWVTSLVLAGEGRQLWEAAAAREGRTLAEWVLLQAARWANSRSTSPQATASG